MNIAARFAAAFTAALMLWVAAPARAAFGDRDCSFGVNGVQTLPWGPVSAIASEASGGMVVRGGYTSVGSFLYRTDAAGTSYASVGSSIIYGINEPEIVVLADGRVLVTNGWGMADSSGYVAPGLQAPGVGRFLAAGGLDTSFGVNGFTRLTGFVVAASGPVVQSDDRILVSGSFDPTPGDTAGATAALARFNSDGSPDTSFGSGGAATNAVAGSVYRSIALQDNGRIVAVSSTKLSRHLSDGQLDGTFGAGGTVDLSSLFGSIRQVRLQPSGKILVAGARTANGSLRLARFDANGALDTTTDGGTGYRDVVSASGGLSLLFPGAPLVLMPDGRPVVAGSGTVVRFGVDLAADSIVALPFALTALAVLPGGRLAIGVDTGSYAAGQVRRLLGDADVATCVATSTTLTSSPNPSTFGQSVTLTATVTPASVPPAQGSVQFKRDGVDIGFAVALINGVATRAVSTLPEGPSNLTATYLNTNTGVHAGSISSPITHNVALREDTVTTLTASPNPSNHGEPVTLTATVSPGSSSGPVTGTVEFVRGSSGYIGPPVAVSGGVATTTTTTLPDGTYDISAVYSGDGSYRPSTSVPVAHSIPGRLTIYDASVNAASGPTSLAFGVTLSAGSGSTVTVSYATSDRTAEAGTHYTATSGTLTFAPGETFKNIAVPISQSQPGPNKDFFLSLTNPTNATLAKGAGIGTIVHTGSSTLAIYINDPSVAEGFSGVTLLGFNLSLSQPSSTTVNANYATADGTAIAGTDYIAQSGTISFPPGITQRWVMVPIIGNAVVEANRTFVVNLTNPTVAAIGRPQGIGTVIDDDPTPAAIGVPQYRLYSDVTKEHLYTTDANEYAVLGTANWVQEGVAYTMFANSGTYNGETSIPLYRLYHPGIRQHHWTTDANEVSTLVMTYGSWQYEGIPGYLLPNAVTGTTPLYRLSLRNPPLHLWTTDANEMNVLSTPQYGWTYEGVIGEVLP